MCPSSPGREHELRLCPDCGKHINVFGDSHVDEIADKYKPPVLAKMPIDPELAKEPMRA